MVPSFEAALARAKDCAKARGTDEIMVIGGADIFAASLPLAGRIYKTEVHGRPEGDTLMPEVDWKAWREVSREALPRGPHDDYGATLVRLERGGRPGRQPPGPLAGLLECRAPATNFSGEFAL